MTTTTRKKCLSEQLQRLKTELAERESANRPMSHSVRTAYKASIARCETSLRRL